MRKIAANMGSVMPHTTNGKLNMKGLNWLKKRLKALKKENSKLKRIIVEQALDIQALKGVLKNRTKA